MSILNKFEQIYMEKYWNVQLSQWNNYFEHGNYNLSFIDNENYNIVTQYYNLIKPVDRKSEVAHLLMQKDLVDKNPIVSQLRNKIDNIDNYRDSITVDIKEDRNKYLQELSLKMRNDVIDLMIIRNKLARKLGFYSYPDLVFNYEELDKNMLIEFLNNYVDRNLPKVKKLIEKNNIKWGSWLSDLDRISKPVSEINHLEIMNQLMDKMGFHNIFGRLQIIYVENDIAGMASEIAPGDIRIAAVPVKALSDLNTLFHELGHAIAYYFNKEEGLYKILPGSYDEAMAVVMEHIAPKLVLDDKAQEIIENIQVLEYTRCAISSLYEFELWNDPEQGEDLYVKHFSKLGVEINQPYVWSLDSFRSIDPVYIHNYVIGKVLAEQIEEYFLKNYSTDYKQWGNWLINNIYIDGRKRAFKEKLKLLFIKNF